MAKRKTEEMLKCAKKSKSGEGGAGYVHIPSAIALDPRMPTWPVTSFKDGKARIYSWNVNGLRAVMGKQEIQNFLKSEDIDVLCLNETKIDEGKIEKEKIGAELFPDKYLQFWNCCKGKAGYAGTAIFSKVKPLDVKFDLGIMKHDLEGRTITLEFENFFLVACYVPNAGQKLDRLDYRTKEWDPDFKNYLKGLEQTKQKCVILCGDLNVAHQEIDICNPKGNLKSAGFTVQERAEFTNLLNAGFADSFRRLHPTEVKYSYWNMRSGARAQNKGWRLDYFVVSESLMSAIDDTDMVSHVMGSDHCPLKFILDVGRIQKPGIGGCSSPVPILSAKEEEKKESAVVKPKSIPKAKKKEKEKEKEKEKKAEPKAKKKKDIPPAEGSDSSDDLEGEDDDDEEYEIIEEGKGKSEEEDEDDEEEESEGGKPKKAKKSAPKKVSKK